MYDLKTIAASKPDWFSEIKNLYSMDDIHTSVHHTKAGQGIDECVKYTIGVLSEEDKTMVMKVVNAGNDFEVVGLFSDDEISGTSVMSFWFINPKYRTETGILSFWKAVKKHFGSSFLTAADVKNDKAIEHLTRQGFLTIMKFETSIIFKCN